MSLYSNMACKPLSAENLKAALADFRKQAEGDDEPLVLTGPFHVLPPHWTPEQVRAYLDAAKEAGY